MSMLQSLMANAQNAASSHRSGSTKEDPTKKEERAAYRRMLENAVKPDSGYTQEQIAGLTRNAPAGVDPTIYTTIAGMQSPAQIAKQKANADIYNQFAQIMNGGKPTQRPMSAPSEPTFTPSGAIQVKPQTQTEPTQPNVPANIFTKDFVVRKVLKDLSGIDVGGHYLDSPQWFESYGKRINSGMPASQAMTQTAVEHGFVPSGASNLKELSDTERKVIFEREFATALSDPILDAIVKKIIPKGVNLQKAKAGLVLNAFSEQGLYIPDHYQPFLDRFRGLEDPEFVSDDLKTQIYRITGKLPSEIEPSDIANAQRMIEDRNLFNRIRGVTEEQRATAKVENELQQYKVVTAEDMAKQGINAAKYPTYASIADSGKRFPSEKERITYSTVRDSIVELTKLKDTLFGKNGVFTGMGNTLGGRLSRQAELRTGVVTGNKRWINMREYEAARGRIVSKLARLSGEVGVLNEGDIQRQVSALPDTGAILALPDPEELAFRKYFHYIEAAEERLNSLLKTTTIQSTTTSPTQYEIGKIYTDAKGNKAKYIGGDKPWERQ